MQMGMDLAMRAALFPFVKALLLQDMWSTTPIAMTTMQPFTLLNNIIWTPIRMDTVQQLQQCSVHLLHQPDIVRTIPIVMTIVHRLIPAPLKFAAMALMIIAMARWMKIAMSSRTMLTQMVTLMVIPQTRLLQAAVFRLRD